MDVPTNSRLNTIRLLIADDQSEFRAGLRSQLESEQGAQVVGEASDSGSLLELTCRLDPDILLLDSVLFEQLQASGPDGMTAFPTRVRTLVMVATPDKSVIVEAFRLGARGVVVKDSTPRVWLKSIRAVAAGEYWLGSESVAVIVDALREFLTEATGGAPPNNYGLTPRELEIVKRIAHGRSNKEVGLEFSICERTVKHHLTNIFSKLGVSSRLKLALFARDNHILQGTAPDRSAPGSQHSEYLEV